MNELAKLMTTGPQVVDAIHGPEPTLAEMVAYYYESHGFSKKDTKKAVTEYFDALFKECAK